MCHESLGFEVTGRAIVQVQESVEFIQIRSEA